MWDVLMKPLRWKYVYFELLYSKAVSTVQSFFLDIRILFFRRPRIKIYFQASVFVVHHPTKQDKT